MKKVIITGGEGKLAKEIVKANTTHFGEYVVLTPSKIEMNLTSLDSVMSYISKHSPDIVIHAGAYTRPMKKHQDNPDVSIQTNIVGTSNVVLACIKANCKLVYISTDYVYPGVDGNYNESSPLSPYEGNNDGITKYGWSKLGGECAVRMYDNSLILRTCICDNPFPHDKAAVDVRKSFMFNNEAAKVILGLLEENGVINVGGEGRSVYDFVSTFNPKVEKLERANIPDVKIAPDTTMDITRMKNILGNNIGSL